jgi:hypothetical protein
MNEFVPECSTALKEVLTRLDFEWKIRGKTDVIRL